MKKKIFRRQDAPKTYDLNAAIYIWKRKSLVVDATSSLYEFNVTIDRNKEEDEEETSGSKFRRIFEFLKL